MVAHQLESRVRFYSRSYPAMFGRAQGARMYDADGRAYIDFLSGCGALNYGHNPPHLVESIQRYLAEGNILHSLDMASVGKQRFLERFFQTVLKPRQFDYRVQFTGPTGTNAVEAALKLARKVTGRHTVVAFTNGFHGVTTGALSVTASASKRAAAGVALGNTIRMPYDGFLGGDELRCMETMLTRAGSGIEPPAAFILETVQGEGGLSVASIDWLRGVERLARRLGALLIVDDIQAGCGRTSGFFSFERAGIRPDLICLSKSLSGLGLPLSIVLIAPEHDIWEPGEHNGTFRGNSLAFVSAAAALDFWEQPGFQEQVAENARIMHQTLAKHGPPKGLGMMLGVQLTTTERAARVRNRAFERGLILETCGPDDRVVKLLPPLNIDSETLAEGLEIVTAVLDTAGE